MIENLLTTVKEVHPSGKEGIGLQTVEGSIIRIFPLPIGMTVTGFNRFSAQQKSTWKLHTASITIRSRYLGILFPMETERDYIYIPLVRLDTVGPDLYERALAFGRVGNAMLQRTWRI